MGITSPRGFSDYGFSPLADCWGEGLGYVDRHLADDRLAVGGERLMFVGHEYDFEDVLAFGQFGDVVPGAVDPGDFAIVEQQVGVAFGGFAALIHLSGVEGEVGKLDFHVPSGDGVGGDDQLHRGDGLTIGDREGGMVMIGHGGGHAGRGGLMGVGAMIGVGDRGWGEADRDEADREGKAGCSIEFELLHGLWDWGLTDYDIKSPARKRQGGRIA
jgi:hypothetical protein